MSKAKQTIHLMGIAGKGMGAFAGLLKQAGYDVRGSDQGAYPPMSTKLEQWGIPIMTPYCASNLSDGPDLVVVGNVIRREHIEAEEMRRRNLEHVSFPALLYDLFLKDRPTFVAAGTHGKTTTSGMLSETLFHLGADPGFLVGGVLKHFDESFRVGGAAAPFVVEGDEYDTAYFDKGPKFLHYRPNYLQLTSLEFDHADIYDSIASIEKRFVELVQHMSDGDVAAIADLEELDTVAESRTSAHIVRYGFKDTSNYRCNSERAEQGETRFRITHPNGETKVVVPLMGRHNTMNVTGAFAVLHQYGFEPNAIAEALQRFKGTGQRMDCLGTTDKLKLYDDYAHHPTAVETTLNAVRENFPGHELIALFEAGSATSCRKFFQDDYARSLAVADHVYIAPLGRQLPSDESLDVSRLVKDIQQKSTGRVASFESHDDLMSQLVHDLNSSQSDRPVFILMMSNGSFGGLRMRLKEHFFGDSP